MADFCNMAACNTSSFGGPTTTAGSNNSVQAPAAPGPAQSSESDVPQLKNILSHVDSLEKSNKEKEAEIKKLQEQLKITDEKAQRFSKVTSDRMQAVLKTLAQQWIDPMPPENAENADEKQKEEFQKAKESCKSGLEKIVKNSDENSGVWRLMVAASAQHARQQHNLEQMRIENNELKLKLDGRFGEESARVGDKRPALEQLDRHDEMRDSAETITNMWDLFAKDVGDLY